MSSRWDLGEKLWPFPSEPPGASRFFFVTFREVIRWPPRCCSWRLCRLCSHGRTHTKVWPKLYGQGCIFMSRFTLNSEVVPEYLGFSHVVHVVYVLVDSPRNHQMTPLELVSYRTFNGVSPIPHGWVISRLLNSKCPERPFFRQWSKFKKLQKPISRLPELRSPWFLGCLWGKTIVYENIGHTNMKIMFITTIDHADRDAQSWWSNRIRVAP